MKIIVAKNSGFCNGVRRSVDLANKASEKNIKTYTLGPLVHNPTQVKMLEKKGVSVVDENEVLEIKNSQIVIRSHGVSENLKENLKNNSNEVVDATCPVLLNIYKKIIEKENEGYTVVIIGDKEHPEIKAMASYVNNGIIIKDETEAKNITNMSKLYVVSQTTNRIDFFENIAHELEKTNDDVVIENTICNATRLRQEACKSLSKEVDCMIVVGGFNSSNTNKLYQIAQKYCENVQRIETVKDLPLQKLSNFNIIGVIAGASTPDQVIEEVVNRMDDLTNEELMNKYRTPFIIWANYDIKEKTIDKMSANYLSAYVMNEAGLETSPYQKFLLKLRKKLPVLTAMGCFDKKGKYYESALESPYSDMVKEYQILQYNNLIDTKHTVNSFFYLSDEQKK